MTITLYHNPRCSTSRSALALLREHGVEPHIIDYLQTPLSRDALAEIIILDQFSRNLYRDNPLAFAQDGMALILAQEAIQQKDFAQMEMIQRKFMLMPFMHSESAAMHEWATALFSQYTDALTIDFEAKHKAIIDRFGRYPHRNEILGRKSSAEEITFLQQPDSAF